MKLLRWFGLLLLLVLVGCVAQNPLTQELPESNFLVCLSDAELFAVHPDGDMVAYVDSGLHLLRISDNYHQQLTFDSPQALIWSPDGNYLVAAYREAEKTRLVRLSASAEDRPQVFVDEQIADFAWLDDGRLLALGQTIEDNDGVLHLQVRLLIWDGLWDVERIPLYEKNFYRGPSEYNTVVEHYFDLSPLNDELIYNRYLDSPVIGGRVELVLYNLNTGRELVLARTDNRQDKAFCGDDGESVFMPVGHDEVQLVNPWTKKVQYNWSAEGESMQIGAGRDLFYLDGRLYSGDRLMLSLPAKANVKFSADGERMFAAWRRKLYLFTGYDTPKRVTYTDTEKDKLERIRQQRSSGEISIREYYKLRNNILNP